VTPGTPAARAGFMPGDIITKATLTTKLLAESYNGTNAEGYSTLVASDADGDPLTFMIIRGGKTLNITAIPVEKIIPGAPTRPALGFTMTEIAIVKTSADQAPTQGVYYTWNVTKETAVGLYDFFKHIVLFKADLSQVSGPIGIAGAVGTATSQGAAAVLTLAGLISINLAIINLLPIPALDGGRLLFVIIESIIRRPLNPKIAERVNLVGFALLILLMLVVSAHDIFKLIH
jgi:regulator of sigma E protease